MTSQLMQNKDYHSLFECLGVLLVPQTLVTPFCKQFGNNFDKLWRGYKTFRPRLTKYCRGCVPGIPGGVDAFASFDKVGGRGYELTRWTKPAPVNQTLMSVETR